MNDTDRDINSHANVTTPYDQDDLSETTKMSKLIAAYEAELQMRIREYEWAVDSAIELLQQNRGRVTTHLGHNLANRATDLSVVAARVEAAQVALTTIKELA